MDHFLKTEKGQKGELTFGSSPIGFITKTEIDQLTSINDSVGIRVYDLMIQNQGNKLLFTSVDKNGFELGNQYLLNHISAGTDPRSEMITRAISVLLSQQTNFSTRFVSFFSSDMLSELTRDLNFTGVAFFKNIVSLGDVTVRNFETHSAVPARVLNGQIISMESNGRLATTISNKPCPGHCVELEDESDLSTILPKASQTPRKTDGIYIFQWQ